MSKAQAEILGLLFIVVLVLFLGVLFLVFTSFREQPLPELRANLQTTYLLEALVRSPLQGVAFEEAMVSCATDQNCTLLEAEIPRILTLTATPSYLFQLRKEPATEPFLSLGTCTAAGPAATYTFPLETGVYHAFLRVCR